MRVFLGVLRTQKQTC